MLFDVYFLESNLPWLGVQEVGALESELIAFNDKMVTVIDVDRGVGGETCFHIWCAKKL